MGAVIIAIVGFIVLIFVLRLLGAWMFRINEVINLQKEMLNEIKKHNNNQIS